MPPESAYRGGEGEPLVLLHGFTDTWRAWRLVLPALSEHFAVFAPTLPGHHGGPPYDGDEITVDGALAQLGRMLADEGIEHPHVAGNSLGGWYGLQMAARGMARSVTAICPAGGWEPGSAEDRATLAFFARTSRSLKLGRPLFETIAKRPRLRRAAMRELIPDPSRVNATDAYAMMEGALETAIYDDSIAVARRGEAFGELGPIDVPVTIAYGTRDRLVRWPSHYERLRQMLPEADYEPVEGAGHMPMWEQPDRIVELILRTSRRSAP
jgi:pimeloyl-ACP methyl ester carboxylesterase